MRKYLVFLILYGCIGGAAAQLVLRTLPPGGQRGVVGEPQPLPLVQIGDKTLRLAPGGVIFDQHNRTIVHAHLKPGSDVYYQLAPTGEILRLYLLTADERARLEQAASK
jgi:hypothetical protein